MTLVKNAVTDKQEIIDYLHDHPDFFIEHPEILSSLNIPHITTGNVTSFVEYQVHRLREQITELRQNKGILEQNSDKNRRFAKNIHELSLLLLDTKNINELYSCLYKNLKYFYSADRVLLLIFSDKQKKTHHQDMRFLQTTSNLNFMFTELFHRGKPLCDSLQEEHLQILFNDDFTSIKSTVIAPHVEHDWQGLLVLASHENNPYHQGTALDLLVFLKDITFFKIQAFIATRKQPIPLQHR